MIGPQHAAKVNGSRATIMGRQRVCITSGRIEKLRSSKRCVYAVFRIIFCGYSSGSRYDSTKTMPLVVYPCSVFAATLDGSQNDLCIRKEQLH